MVVVLNVAEKPSVAKTVSNVLSEGHSRTRRGPSQYNPIFDFKMQLTNPHTRNRENADMRFTSVTGHMMGIDFTAAHSHWSSCDPVELFQAPVAKYVPDDKKDLMRNLQMEARNADWLVLWLDCDREGENIAYEVIDVCMKVRPRLQVFRAKFSTLVKRDLIHACNTLGAPNERFTHAVDARIEIDLRIGAAFTRFMTMRLQKKFPALNDRTISYGPCQFPTLGFIVERFQKIQQFVSEPFWRINLEVKEDNQVASFDWNRNRLFDHHACLALYEMCVDSPDVIILDVKGSPKEKWRPLPLSTVEFQKKASRWLRIQSAEAMDIAEKLYQKGILSYPRTETDMFEDSIDLKALVYDQTGHPVWGNYANDLLNTGGFQSPRRGGSNDKAHPPIHPTKMVSDLQGKEKQVYELISRHFLACCSMNAKGRQTKVHARVGGEEFTASGLAIIARNYLDIYKYEKWNAKTIPDFIVGQVYQPSTLVLHESKTQPPTLLSESDLIALMDKNGIGTDATIAQHIKTVQDRSYCRLQSAQFHPTQLGIALVEGYEEMQQRLQKPDLRARMERRLDNISRGQALKEDVLKETLDEMKAAFLEVKSRADHLDANVGRFFDNLGARANQDQTVVAQFSQCGVCQQIMAQKKDSSTGKLYLHCATCSTAFNLPARGELSSRQHHCPICNFQVLNVTNSDTNKTHSVCPHCFNTPPPDIENATPGNFRCFSCTRSDCKLAEKAKQDPVRPCHHCHKSMSLSETQQGTPRLRCDDSQCNTSIYLNNCTSVKLTDQLCHNCSARCGKNCFKLEFKFQAAPVYVLNENGSFLGCVGGCDDDLAGYLGLQQHGIPRVPRIGDVPVARPRPRANNAGLRGGRGGSARGQGRGRRGGNAQPRGRGRGGARTRGGGVAQNNGRQHNGRPQPCYQCGCRHASNQNCPA